LSNSTCNLL